MYLKAKKKAWSPRLFYKTLYSYTKTNSNYLYDPISYKSLLLLATRIWVYKEKTYINSSFFFLNYKGCITEGVILDLEYLNSDFEWKYLREDRRYNYHFLKLIYFLKPLYIINNKSIFNYYYYYFNSFIYKDLFLKNYSMYKTQFLTEYVCKFFFFFENTYFIDYFSVNKLRFNLLSEHYCHIYYFEDYIPKNSLEFFYIKNNFFKNNFYNFFFKKSVFYLSENKKTLFWTDYLGVKKNYFMQYKYLTINNFIFKKIFFLNKKLKKKNKFLISKNECSNKMYFFYLYKILIFYFLK